jgi:hypothetical protein
VPLLWAESNSDIQMQLTKLNYRFENDGVFWMTYADLLGTFTNLYRTRLFDDSWSVTQEWTGVNVAWLTGYLQRKFVVEVKEAGTVIFVLQQARSLTLLVSAKLTTLA